MAMNKSLLYLSVISLAVTSCGDFLDTVPDDRIELDSKDKVTKMLVSAYPTISTMLISELSSDNATDNGAQYDTYGQVCGDAYQWKDITTDDTDAPKSVWDAHYNAIAAANQALAAIERLGGGEEYNAQKGEALICRAFAHFQLANLFCMPYDATKADNTLGIPYSTEPETEVLPDGIERGTLAHTYEMIDKDIEEGLPLINDDIYTVPKYHFNQKAAYAFAARFNLYYHRYDKVIEYADKVLGSNPAASVRNWKSFSELATDFELRCNSYVSATEPCNLMLLAASSSWPYVQGPYGIGLRYGNSYDIMLNEVLPGPWGAYNKLYMSNGIWGFEQKYSLPKLLGYFEYTDKTAGIGYLHLVNVAFSTDELLLCRAEAKLLKTPQDIDGAVDDINILLNSMAGMTLTKEQIINYFTARPYMPLHIKTSNQRSIKKELHPQGFSIPDSDTENLIQCVLHLRRVSTVHEGLRWNDIKRFGIELAHPRSGKSDDELLVDDPRRAVQIPQEVIAAGLEANPRNN